MGTSAFWGTWRLVVFEVRGPEGEVSHPFGTDAAGFLMYGQDGYMAAALMMAKRANFASADILEASPEEKAAAFDSYSSYCGRYEVKGSRVIHHIQCSQLPNWSGTDQERFFEFSEDGKRLTLRTPPMLAGGVERTLVAVWERVKT
jgi:hypothetical protein